MIYFRNYDKTRTCGIIMETSKQTLIIIKLRPNTHQLVFMLLHNFLKVVPPGLEPGTLTL